MHQCYSWTLLMVCCSFALCQKNDDCEAVGYPDFVNLINNTNNSVELFDNSGQYLIVSYQFACQGVITEWEVYTEFNKLQQHPIEFQVWRLNQSLSTNETYIYSLVGLNSITESDARPEAETNILTIKVPPNEQIEVSPGDIVGLRTYIPGDQDQGFQIQAYMSQMGDTTFLQSNNNKTETQSTLTISTSDENITTLMNLLPVVLARVEAHAESVATSPPSITTDNITAATTHNDSGYTTQEPGQCSFSFQQQMMVIIITASITFTSTLLVVFCVAISCMMIIIRRIKRHHESDLLKKYRANSCFTDGLVDNPAYKKTNNNSGDIRDSVYYSTISHAHTKPSDELVVIESEYAITTEAASKIGDGHINGGVDEEDYYTVMT